MLVSLDLLQFDNVVELYNCNKLLVSLDLPQFDNVVELYNCNKLLVSLDLLQFDNVVELYAEEPKKIKPEEFFGIFDNFLTSLADAGMENQRLRKQKEDEERRAQYEAEVCYFDLPTILTCSV